jgi:glutathione S-transferase
MAFETVDFPADEVELKSLTSAGTNLFNNIICPFGQRSLWTAVEIGSPFRMIDVPLSAMPPAYGQLVNRYETVPCLYDEGVAVFESAIVAEYLDAKFGEGRLFCRDSPAMASLHRLVSSKFEIGAFYGLLRNKDSEKRAELEGEIHATLTELETIYRDNAAAYRANGPFLLGSRFSAAEIMIMPFLYRFQAILAHYRSFDVLGKYPLLRAAFEASKERPAFKESSRPEQFYIEAYASYAN